MQHTRSVGCLGRSAFSDTSAPGLVARVEPMDKSRDEVLVVCIRSSRTADQSSFFHCELGGASGQFLVQNGEVHSCNRHPSSRQHAQFVVCKDP